MTFAIVALLSVVDWPISYFCFSVMYISENNRTAAREYLSLFIVGGVCLVEFGLGWEVPSLGQWRVFFIEAALIHYLIGAVFYLYLTVKAIRKGFH